MSLDKNTFKDGDVILVHNYFDLVLNAILFIPTQGFTRCYYHHCAMYLKGYIYESIASGVTKTHKIEDYIKDVGATREIMVCRFPNAKEEEITGNVGVPYNWGATLFFQLIYQLTNRYFGKKKPKRLNCSQYDGKCIGIENFGSIDPQDIYRMAKEQDVIVYESHPKRREYVMRKLKG